MGLFFGGMTRESVEPSVRRGGSELRRNLRGLTLEGVYATPWVTLAIPGNLFVASLVTSALGISAGDYGILVSLPAWFNALQLLFIPLFERFLSTRAIMVWGGFLNVGIWLALSVTLGFLPTDDPRQAFLILFIYYVFLSFTQSLNGVAWMSWLQGWVPRRLRGRYFGRRNGFLGAFTVLFVLIAGWTIENFDEGILGYQLLFGFAGLLRVLSVWKCARISASEPPQPRPPFRMFPPFRAMFSVRPFGWFVLFNTMLAFWMGFLGPFVPLYMGSYLELPVAHQATFVMLANLAAAVAMPIWGRLMDRHGCKPVIALSAILWMSVNYLWIILTPGLSWLLFPMWLWGGCVSGGVMLGVFNLLLKVVPPDLKSGGVSVNLMITSLVAAVAPICGGFLLGAESLFNLRTETLFRIAFFLQPTAIMLSLLLLRPLVEPDATPMRALVGPLRTWRTTLVGQGYMVFGNWVFFRRRRRPSKARH